jgi:hypothetical protein
MVIISKQSIRLSFLLAISAVSLTFGDNMLKNFRFQEVENGLPRVGAASTWGGEAKFEISEAGFHDKSCLMISSETGGNASWGQKIILKPYHKYKLWGFIKTENLKDEGWGAVLSIHGTDSKTRSIKGTNDWQYVECLFESTGGEVMINCLFGGWGDATGKAWFDDIGVESLGPVKYEPKFSKEAAKKLIDQGVDKLIFVKRMKYQSNHYYTDYITAALTHLAISARLILRLAKLLMLSRGLKVGCLADSIFRLTLRKLCSAGRAQIILVTGCMSAMLTAAV